MKVLLVSNVPQGLDRVVKVLDTEGATVITKEINANAKEMVKQAYDIFMEGNFDMIVALTDNSVTANIAFNKLEGASAAVCETVDDASLAKENDANVIIIKNPESDSVTDILNVATQKGGFKISKIKNKIMKAKPKKDEAAIVESEPEEDGQRPKQHAAIQPSKPQQSSQPKQSFSIPLFQQKPVQQAKQQPKPQQKADEHKEIPLGTGPKRDGIMGWMKDELGIIDQKPQPKPPQKKQSRDKEQQESQ